MFHPHAVVSELDHPDVSFWLRRAFSQSVTRNPGEALADAETLVRLLKQRLGQFPGRSEWIGPLDNSREANLRATLQKLAMQAETMAKDQRDESTRSALASLAKQLHEIVQDLQP